MKWIMYKKKGLKTWLQSQVNEIKTVDDLKQVVPSCVSGTCTIMCLHNEHLPGKP